ncbi:MAG: hypothetical protein FJ267_11745 [Planctomycetes bacterium]|nr:hypothetical protein [Planctomycetota bacterium]
MASYPSRVILVIAGLLLIYVLSSGPVLATAFMLREATGDNRFYAVMWFYFPIFLMPRFLWGGYISWWVELFGTVGPV